MTLKLKILIVDDIEDVADSLAILLTLEGHQVSVSYTALAGIKEAISLKPDVILHDLAMPRMTGFDAVSLLRKGVQFTSTLILAISANDTVENRIRAKSEGFDDFVAKPADLEALLRLIDSKRPCAPSHAS